MNISYNQRRQRTAVDKQLLSSHQVACLKLSAELSCKETLRDLSLFVMKKGKFLETSPGFSVSTRMYQEDRARLLTAVCSRS